MIYRENPAKIAEILWKIRSAVIQKTESSMGCRAETWTAGKSTTVEATLHPVWATLQTIWARLHPKSYAAP